MHHFLGIEFNISLQISLRELAVNLHFFLVKSEKNLLLYFRILLSYIHIEYIFVDNYIKLKTLGWQNEIQSGARF